MKTLILLLAIPPALSMFDRAIWDDTPTAIEYAASVAANAHDCRTLQTLDLMSEADTIQVPENVYYDHVANELYCIEEATK